MATLPAGTRLGRYQIRSLLGAGGTAEVWACASIGRPTAGWPWERAHRVLGRVLFWCGLAGLAASFVLPWPVSIGLFLATITLAVSWALFESWRTWRDDPDRNGGARLDSMLRPATK